MKINRKINNTRKYTCLFNDKQHVLGALVIPIMCLSRSGFFEFEKQVRATGTWLYIFFLIIKNIYHRPNDSVLLGRVYILNTYRQLPVVWACLLARSIATMNKTLHWSVTQPRISNWISRKKWFNSKTNKVFRNLYVFFKLTVCRIHTYNSQTQYMVQLLSVIQILYAFKMWKKKLWKNPKINHECDKTDI